MKLLFTFGDGGRLVVIVTELLIGEEICFDSWCELSEQRVPRPDLGPNQPPIRCFPRVLSAGHGAIAGSN